MARNISTAMTDLSAALTDERKARAALREHAANAHLAAVMGPSLTRNTRPGDWQVEDVIDNDAQLTAEINKAYRAAPGLRQAIEANLSWLLQEVDKGLCTDIKVHTPAFDPNLTDPSETREAMEARKAHEDCVAAIEEKLKAAREETEALLSSRGINGITRSRSDCIDRHTEQITYVNDMAKQLAFGDAAMREVTSDIDEPTNRN